MPFPLRLAIIAIFIAIIAYQIAPKDLKLFDRGSSAGSSPSIFPSRRPNQGGHFPTEMDFRQHAEHVWQSDYKNYGCVMINHRKNMTGAIQIMHDGSVRAAIGTMKGKRLNVTKTRVFSTNWEAEEWVQESIR